MRSAPPLPRRPAASSCEDGGTRGTGTGRAWPAGRAGVSTAGCGASDSPGRTPRRHLLGVEGEDASLPGASGSRAAQQEDETPQQNLQPRRAGQEGWLSGVCSLYVLRTAPGLGLEDNDRRPVASEQRWPRGDGADAVTGVQEGSEVERKGKHSRIVGKYTVVFEKTAPVDLTC